MQEPIRRWNCEDTNDEVQDLSYTGKTLDSMAIESIDVCFSLDHVVLEPVWMLKKVEVFFLFKNIFLPFHFYVFGYPKNKGNNLLFST